MPAPPPTSSSPLSPLSFSALAFLCSSCLNDRCCHRLDLLVCLILLENFCCASFKATLPAPLHFLLLLLPATAPCLLFFFCPCPNHILWPSLLANFYASSKDGQTRERWPTASREKLVLFRHCCCCLSCCTSCNLCPAPSPSTTPSLLQPAFLAASELIKLSSKLFFAFKRAWQTKCDC